MGAIVLGLVGLMWVGAELVPAVLRWGGVIGRGRVHDL